MIWEPNQICLVRNWIVRILDVHFTYLLQVNVRFQAVIDCVEQARQEVLSDVKRKRDEKRKILDEQINIIQAEKAKVDTDIQVKY